MTDRGDDFRRDMMAEASADIAIGEVEDGLAELDDSDAEPVAEQAAEPAEEEPLDFVDDMRSAVERAEGAEQRAEEWAAEKAEHRAWAKSHGVSDVEALRRSRNVDQFMKTDPLGFLGKFVEQLAAVHGQTPGLRQEAIARVARALGADGIDPRLAASLNVDSRVDQAIAARERAAQAQQHRAVVHQAHQKIADFARTAPDFEELRFQAAAIMAATGKDIASAFADARTLRDLPQQRARAAAENRQQAIAKAKRAATPRTASASVAEVDQPRGSFADDLRAAFGEATGGRF
jgi:hypothetical protein